MPSARGPSTPSARGPATPSARPPWGSRGPGPAGAALLWAALGLGCGPKVSRVGLIDAGAPRLALVETTGQRHRLALDPHTDEAQLLALGGCLVRVEGVQGPGGLRVGRYHVLDAGDGSAPYIGQLREDRGQLVVFDRQGAGDLRLIAGEAGPGLEGLRALLGQDVLVLGFVVANQTVQVVKWRPLGPHLPPAAR